MRALIIDDSRAIRLILSRLMDEIGIATETAENGRAALEVLRLATAIDEFLHA